LPVVAAVDRLAELRLDVLEHQRRFTSPPTFECGIGSGGPHFASGRRPRF
jgi:hypothetical protein